MTIRQKYGMSFDPVFSFDNVDNHFDNQSVYFNALFCIFLYLYEGIRKTPRRLISLGFCGVAQIGLEPMTLRV